MRATVMFGAGDVRIENVPDAQLIEPTDAVVWLTERFTPCRWAKTMRCWRHCSRSQT
jgi:hypothetical protein